MYIYIYIYTSTLVEADMLVLAWFDVVVGLILSILGVVYIATFT